LQFIYSFHFFFFHVFLCFIPSEKEFSFLAAYTRFGGASKICAYIFEFFR
jgi:hypothetical protein